MNMIIGVAAMTSAAAITNAEAGFVEPSSADPVFDLIDAHRKADLAVQAALNEARRLQDLAKKITGMNQVRLSIPSPNPHSGNGPIEITSKYDIDQIVCRKRCPELNRQYHAQWDKLAAEREAITGDLDALLDGPVESEWAAMDKLVSCVPATLAGFRAWIGYLNALHDTDDDRISQEQFRSLLSNIAETLNGLSASRQAVSQAGRAVSI